MPAESVSFVFLDRLDLRVLMQSFDLSKVSCCFFISICPQKALKETLLFNSPVYGFFSENSNVSTGDVLMLGNLSNLESKTGALSGEQHDCNSILLSNELEVSEIGILILFFRTLSENSRG